MDILFGVLGVLAIVFVILLVIIVAFLKGIAGTVKQAVTGTPVRIHLHEVEDLKWQNARQEENYYQEFLSLGFKDLGYFRIEEMPAVKLRTFVKAAEGTIGVIYEMAPLGIWLDVVKYHSDETSITASTATRGQELKHRPGHDKVRSPGADPRQLMALIKERSKVSPKDIADSKEGFKKLFEKAYADETDWRNSLGGPSEEEIRAIARASGKNASEDAIAMTVKIQHQKAIAGLTVACAEYYKEKHSISASDWKEKEDRIVFVHDKLTDEMTESIFEDAGIVLSEAQTAMLKTMPLRKAFSSILGSRDEKQALKKTDELDKPLPCDVYEAVESD
jgi:hypothetical protein